MNWFLRCSNTAWLRSLQETERLLRWKPVVSRPSPEVGSCTLQTKEASGPMQRLSPTGVRFKLGPAAASATRRDDSSSDEDGGEAVSDRGRPPATPPPTAPDKGARGPGPGPGPSPGGAPDSPFDGDPQAARTGSGARLSDESEQRPQRRGLIWALLARRRPPSPEDSEEADADEAAGVSSIRSSRSLPAALADVASMGSEAGRAQLRGAGGGLAPMALLAAWRSASGNLNLTGDAAAANPPEGGGSFPAPRAPANSLLARSAAWRAIWAPRQRRRPPTDRASAQVRASAWICRPSESRRPSLVSPPPLLPRPRPHAKAEVGLCVTAASRSNLPGRALVVLSFPCYPSFAAA